MPRRDNTTLRSNTSLLSRGVGRNTLLEIPRRVCWQGLSMATPRPLSVSSLSMSESWPGHSCSCHACRTNTSYFAVRRACGDNVGSMRHLKCPENCPPEVSTEFFRRPYDQSHKCQNRWSSVAYRQIAGLRLMMRGPDTSWFIGRTAVAAKYQYMFFIPPGCV